MGRVPRWAPRCPGPNPKTVPGAHTPTPTPNLWPEPSQLAFPVFWLYAVKVPQLYPHYLSCWAPSSRLVSEGWGVGEGAPTYPSGKA